MYDTLRTVCMTNPTSENYATQETAMINYRHEPFNPTKGK